MKIGTTTLLLLATTFAWASQPTALSLPPVAHADTEVVTNVPMPALSQRSGRLAFSLGCHATPTNNVEIAFGTDVDEDGVLAPCEDGIYDRDGDNLLDQSEVSGRWGLKTETNRRDSFNLAQNIADEYLFYGDNEAQARYAENEGLSTSYFPSLDWCNPGCQSKRRRGPLVDETSQAR